MCVELGNDATQTRTHYTYHPGDNGSKDFHVQIEFIYSVARRK